MATKSHVQIELQAETIKLFDRYHKHTGTTPEAYITQLVEKTLPTVQAMVDAIDEASDSPDKNIDVLVFDPNTSWVCHKYFSTYRNGANKINLQTFMLEITNKINSLNKNKLYTFMLSQSEMMQFGEDTIIAFRLPKLLTEFGLSEQFRSELNGLAIESLKAAYSKVLLSNQRVKNNMDEGIFSI